MTSISNWLVRSTGRSLARKSRESSPSIFLLLLLCIYVLIYSCPHPQTYVFSILEQLGSGQFGQVCKGIWSISGNSLQLAVKTLKPDAPSGDKVKFLQEAAIMGQFLHPNVVKLYGVVTVGEPVSGGMIVMYSTTCFERP